MQIRPYQPADAAALYAVFHSAVHGIACRDYRPEQLAAWAPDDFDAGAWTARLNALQPTVVDIEGQPVAYGDLQPDGLIDHFFVAAAHARRGIGRRLLQHLLQSAQNHHIPVVYAQVSRTAQPFFARFGFEVTAEQMAVVRGVSLANARMQRVLFDHTR